jgi:phage-related holin
MLPKNFNSTMNFYFFSQFGFNGYSDFLQSVCTPKVLLLFLKIGAVLAALTTYVELYIGLTQYFFIAFIGLFIADFITGIAAAKHKGEVIKSKKMPRIIFKIVFYLFILTFINLLQIDESELKLLYKWAFWTIFHIINLQNIRSNFENLHNMGYKEATPIYRILNNKFTAKFDVLTGENPDKFTDDTNTEKNLK